METVFWVCVAGVLYSYFGYPIMLIGIRFLRAGQARQRTLAGQISPNVTMIIPAHNEAQNLDRKVQNSLSLAYEGRLQVIVISDGSTDDTEDIVRKYEDDKRLTLIVVEERRGKANALNEGLARAEGEIIVFSDASIILAENAIAEIVRSFADPGVGCVSGEDKILSGEGEGLYGRYELWLRRLESDVGSIVGVSGCFYAQRADLIKRFGEGAAPDFLSALDCLESGYRVIANPKAVGYMSAVSGSRREFQRKVRTVIRGMTALFSRARLLNPVRYPWASFSLFSHKVMRWLVPVFMLALLVVNVGLLDEWLYQLSLCVQVLAYASAVVPFVFPRAADRSGLMRASSFFLLANAAILVAWFQYLVGVRQEIWGPSSRAT